MIDTVELVMKMIGTNKVRYDTLDKIIDGNNLTDCVNIHIDLNSILKPLLDKSIDEGLYGEDMKLHISSNIINIIAHYRGYFTYRRKRYTRFFLYYTDRVTTNGSVYFKQFASAEFKSVYVNIVKALELVSIISKYCNKVYYIKTDKIDPVACMIHNINKHNEYNLVLTKDEMLLQLVNIGNTSILRLKRDESVVICKDNVFNHMLRKTKYEPVAITSPFLSLYYSYAGVPTRSIKGMCKTKIIKKIDDAIISGDIVNSYYPKIELLFDSSSLPNREEVVNNYYNIDAMSLYKKLNSADKIKLDDSIVDKFSRTDLRELNVKFYTGELSIMLEELVSEPRSKTETKWG